MEGFIRASDGTLVRFNVPNSRATVPQAINNDGVVVGYAAMGADLQGFIRTAAGAISLVTLPGDLPVVIFGINNRGALVGNVANQPRNPYKAFVLDPETGVSFLDNTPTATLSATGINDSGVVVGWSFNPNTGAVTSFTATPVKRRATKR
jgi:uncharacterized membrane protein